MRVRKILFFFAAILLLTMTGCSSAETAKKLRVGVRSEIRNFSFYNQKADDFYGLEPDITEELAKRMGCKGVEFVAVNPDTRKEMLQAGKVDCLIAVYSITDTRKENFDFSESYYTDQAKLLVEKSSNIGTLEDLKDGTIGVLSGSNTGPELAVKMYEAGMIPEEVKSNTDTETLFEGLTIKKYGHYSDLSKALEVGEVDAACMDGCIAQTYMNEYRTLLNVGLQEQNYGVATQKGSEMSKVVKEKIQEMLDDGTIEQLKEKWN